MLDRHAFFVPVALAPLLAVLLTSACRRDPWADVQAPSGARTVPSVAAPQIEGAVRRAVRTIDLLAADAPVARRSFHTRRALPAGPLELRGDALVCELTEAARGLASLELEVETAVRVDGVVRVRLRAAEGRETPELEAPIWFDARTSRAVVSIAELAGDQPIHYLTIGPDLEGRPVRLLAARWTEFEDAPGALRWMRRGEVSLRGVHVPSEASARFVLPAGVRRLRFAWSPDGAELGGTLALEGKSEGRVVWREELRAERAARWSEASLELPPEVRELVLLRPREPGGFLVSEARLFDRPAPRERKDLVLITADTLRADHLGCYGSTQTSTPVIDALAKCGVLFERLHTTVNMTNPSHASLFTGLPARDHGVYDNRTRLDDAAVTLAEVLRERDYLCVAAQGAKHMSASFSNLSQGFDRVGESPDWVRSGAWVNRALEEVLPLDAAEPLFLWAHFFDPHTPYGPPAPFDRKYYGDGDPAQPSAEPIPPQFLEELAAPFPVRDVAFPRAQYRAEVDYLDHELGRLLARLEERRRPRVLLFVADHGESLGENGIYFNHGGLLPQVLRVPCILVVDGLEGGRREARAASLVDLLPTLCELLDVEVPGTVRARSLLPWLADPREERAVFFEHAHGLAVGRLAGERYEIVHRVAHRDADYRSPIEAGTTEIVELRGPGLGDRRVGAPLEDAARAALQAFLRAAQPLRSTPAEVDEAGARALRALGYTAPAGVGSPR
ncbi:MAG: sulfatase [Planctomycetes bacterium]|nr:sulfatase [Planctomycetota bacterium]